MPERVGILETDARTSLCWQGCKSTIPTKDQWLYLLQLQVAKVDAAILLLGHYCLSSLGEALSESIHYGISQHVHFASASTL